MTQAAYRRMMMMWSVLGVVLSLLLHACGAEETCGQPEVTPNAGPEFIVGGDEAIPHSWPWMASLHLHSLVDGQDYGHSCGASLIGSRWVLTAAHCIDLSGHWKVEHHHVVFGQHDYKKDAAHPYQVVDIYKHEDYVDKVLFQNDIALLKLAEDVKLDKDIQPVCLPPKDYEYGADTHFMVTGWGHTFEKGRNSPVLNQVAVPIIPLDECSSIPGFNFGIVHENVICAGYKEGKKDACQNDSGGPMVTTIDGRWVQAGIVSWGYGCARPDNPAVYTNVAKYIDWINEKMNS